jgi:hypothetical protein
MRTTPWPRFRDWRLHHRGESGDAGCPEIGSGLDASIGLPLGWSTRVMYPAFAFNPAADLAAA